MPRPKITRRIFFEPECNHFKPIGIPMRILQEIKVTKDELESVRLIDLEQQAQEKAAKKMKISQPTLSRLLNSTRKKIADAIVNSKSIKIQGGVYKMVTQRERGQRAGQGRGRMGGFAAGPGGICKCPKCGYEEPQIRGQPCMNKKCPKCQSQMTRG